MPVSTMESYRRAQDRFDEVLAAVPAGKWDVPSACPPWTVRDVAGHVIWEQEQLRHWATGLEYDRTAGAPGAPRPRELAGTDPMEIWRTARAAATETLTPEALGRTVLLPGLGQIPVAAVVTLLVNEHLVHAWDIAHALGLDVRLDPDLIAESFAWARAHAVRAPGYFGPELTPPPGADERTRWLAFLGRAAWQPASA